MKFKVELRLCFVLFLVVVSRNFVDLDDLSLCHMRKVTDDVRWSSVFCARGGRRFEKG